MHDATGLTARDLTAGYQGPPVVREASVHFAEGLITTLIGPNGCGKSTLLRTLARQLGPRQGSVHLDGVDVWELSGRDFARRLSFLAQTPTVPEGMTVRELVGYGRHPHLGLFGRMGPRDHCLVEEALQATATQDLAEQLISSLSGGQRQRVWIAMALAQDTPFLLLDEPTTFLDPAHQLELLQLVRRLNRERGRTVVMVLHDLALTSRVSDHVVAMRAGRIVAAGPTETTLTPDLVATLFDVTCLTATDPAGRQVLIPWEGL